MGIEPTLRAWEAPVLPLNYTRQRFTAAKNTPHQLIYLVLGPALADYAQRGRLSPAG